MKIKISIYLYIFVYTYIYILYIYMPVRGRPPARAGARRRAPARYPPPGARRRAGAVTRPFFPPDIHKYEYGK